MNIHNAIIYYYKAKEVIYNSGFYYEIYCQEIQTKKNITKQLFYSEYAWVVLSSGMNEKIIIRKFSELNVLFNYWSDPLIISINKSEFKQNALKIFNHSGKIEAIVNMAAYLNNAVIDDEIKKISSDYSYLQKFPFLGPATSLHFAKNLGFVIAKPDRHLVRISNKFGFSCVNEFCDLISNYTGDKQSIVDLVFWRYATIDKQYLETLPNA